MPTVSRAMFVLLRSPRAASEDTQGSNVTDFASLPVSSNSCLLLRVDGHTLYSKPFDFFLLLIKMARLQVGRLTQCSAFSLETTQRRVMGLQLWP